MTLKGQSVGQVLEWPFNVESYLHYGGHNIEITPEHSSGIIRFDLG